mmetsp:Transcript_36417/g.76448  ORF Transcript_36417/g.76448 Transcript_36417/m.76448 type:complete len:1242 (+) Transcript_36417:169-3894(+)
MPGVGRFARKKQLSQQDAPAAAPGVSAAGDQPNAAAATAPENEPTVAPVNTDTSEERPATAFASFENDRPATSGSHGFSAFSNMFGQDIDNSGNVGMFIDATTPAEGTAVEMGGGMDGDQFDFGSGMMSGRDDSGFGAFGGFDATEKDEQPPAAENDADKESSTPTVDANPPAAGPNAAASGSGIGLRGLFAKKRVAAAPSSATLPTNAPEAEPAPKKIVSACHPKSGGGDMMPSMESSVANLSRFNTDLISKNTESATFHKQQVGNVLEGGPNIGGGNDEVHDANSGEVPMTIPTSGDDIDDDLTEATAITFPTTMEVGVGGEPEPQRKNPNITNEHQVSAIKTSPFFSNSASNDLAAKQSSEKEETEGNGMDTGTKESKIPSPEKIPMEVEASTADNNAPREEIVIPGITTIAAAATVDQTSPPKLGERLEAMRAPGRVGNAVAQELVRETSKPDMKPTNDGLGSTLSPHQHQGSAQRVSLSPSGPNMNKSTPFSANAPADVHRLGVATNQAATFSPMGPVVALHRANQATSFSPKGSGPVEAPHPGTNPDTNQTAAIPPNGPVAMIGCANQANSFSPKGPARAPHLGANANRAVALSPKGPVAVPRSANEANVIPPKGPIAAHRPGLNTNQSTLQSINGRAGVPHNSNTPASFLLKGRTDVPRDSSKPTLFLLKGRRDAPHNANQTNSFSPTGRVESKFNQNGITTQDIPAVVANTNIETGNTTMNKNNGTILPTKNEGTFGNFCTELADQGLAQRMSNQKVQHLPSELIESTLNEKGTVVPSVPVAVANTGVEAAQTTMTARLGVGATMNLKNSTLPVKNDKTSSDCGNSGGKVVTNVDANHFDQQSNQMNDNSRVVPAYTPANVGLKPKLQNATNQNPDSAGNANESSRLSKNFMAGKIGFDNFAQIGQMNDNSGSMSAPVNGGSNQPRHDIFCQAQSFTPNNDANTSILNTKAAPATNKPNVQNTRTNTMSKSLGIDTLSFHSSKNTEKVKFAVPENRPDAKSVKNTAIICNKDLEQNNGQFRSNGGAAPSSTAITPDHRRSQSKIQQQSAVTPFARPPDRNDGLNNTVSPTPIKASAPTQFDLSPFDRVVPGMAPAVETKTGDVERRPRSNTMYSPPPRTMLDNSVTPKVSNVNNGRAVAANTNQAAVPASYSANSSAFHTDESFDELLSQFIQDIQEGTDIYDKGQNDLLDLDVDLSHAFAGVLRYKEGYLNLLDEIETMAGNAEAIMTEMAE